MLRSMLRSMPRPRRCRASRRVAVLFTALGVGAGAASLPSTAAGADDSPLRAPIHGVKLYLDQDGLQARYPDYGRLVEELREGGVDAIFTTVYEGRTAFYASRVLKKRNATIDMAALRRRAREGGVAFGAICQIFFDADTLAEHPELAPVDQHGDRSFVNWQKLVCPSARAYRAHKLALVREVARQLRPDVLGLDFMRFPTTWEIVPATAAPAELRDFCFCERCLRSFSRASGVRIPDRLETTPQKADFVLQRHRRAWERWKTATITGFVAEASRAVRAIDRRIRISVHVVPWTEEAFDHGLVRVAGQDVAALGRHVDYLSPMVYHKLIGRPVDEVHALGAELRRRSGRDVLPSIQAAEIESEGQLSADEFASALRGALAPPSAGVLVYQWKELMLDAQASELRRTKHRLFAERAAAPRPAERRAAPPPSTE